MMHTGKIITSVSKRIPLLLNNFLCLLLQVIEQLLKMKYRIFSKVLKSTLNMFNFKSKKGKHFQRDRVSFIKISHLLQ